jgi:hypothetical protein
MIFVFYKTLSRLFQKGVSMKKLSFALVFLLGICGFLFSQTEEQVYIAGSDGVDAVYWLNGKRIVLPKFRHNYT